MLCHKLESSIWNFLYMLLMTCKCAWYFLWDTAQGLQSYAHFFNFLIYPYHLWVSLDRDIFVRPLQRVPKLCPFFQNSYISSFPVTKHYQQPWQLLLFTANLIPPFTIRKYLKLKYHLNIILALCNDKCIIDVILKKSKNVLCSCLIQLLVNFSILLDDNVLPVLIIGDSALLIG